MKLIIFYNYIHNNLHNILVLHQESTFSLSLKPIFVLKTALKNLDKSLIFGIPRFVC